MRTAVKIILGGIAMSMLIATAALASVDVREIGRSNPKKAANYRFPWFNFSESYYDGNVLGVIVGSTRVEAIRSAESAGLTVGPSGWGDNRAGGAALYDRQTLIATMLRQPYLNFHDGDDGKRGMTIHFQDDRVVRIDVHYINAEAI